MRRNLINEGGIRDINALSKRYKEAKIYFHQDLDGVASALAMKNYLENNGIKVVDSEIIQYGDTEFSVKKPDASGDVMPVLVDFAHGKPMFKIHTDHHDSQIGVDTKKTSGQFKKARSNAETISQSISKSDLFSDTDILIINTVDSADFVRQGLTTDDVINYLFKFDKLKRVRENKLLMGLVANKLLLAFKNKKGFLEYLVMNSNPSILSILNNIKKWMKENTTELPADLQANAEKYIQSMKDHKDVEFKDGIIYQYGMGTLKGTGSYDRYTSFKNQPDADFLIIYWPLGLIQVSKNPFKPNPKYSKLHLGELAQKVMGQFKPMLEDKLILLSTIKWVSESKATEESVGFTFNDFYATYGDKYYTKEGAPKTNEELKGIMDKLFSELTEEEKKKLDSIALNAWDLIQANSGGHPSITNISGLNFIGRGSRPPSKEKKTYAPKSTEPRTYAPKSNPDEYKMGSYKSAPKAETQYLTLMKDIASKIKTKLEKEISSY
jgi:hypothetical protein